MKNVYNGEEINGYNHKGFRAKFVLTPTQDVKATFIADYMYAHDSYATGVMGVATNPLFADALAPVVPTMQNREVNHPDGPAEQDTNWGLSAQVDWKLGSGYTLTSISADSVHWRPSRKRPQPCRLHAAFAGTAHHLAKGRFLRLCSRPIRATYPGRRELWPRRSQLLEFDAAEYRAGTHPLRCRGFDVDGDNFDRTSTSTVAVPGINPSFASSGFTDANGLSERTGLDFDLTNDTMLYATCSHGYKGPAIDTFFNMEQRGTIALKPEESNSYEIGVKAQTPDHRYTANLALFDAYHGNYHTNFFTRWQVRSSPGLSMPGQYRRRVSNSISARKPAAM